MKQEVLSQEWIDGNRRFAGELMDEEAVVKARDLIKLLIPKQESQVVLEHIDAFITRAFDLETTSQTIEMLTGMTIEQVVEGFRDGTFTHKHELPVLPKYVAGWITQYRKVFDLYPALEKLENHSSTWERTYEWYRLNTHEFVNAYLTGEYEVEEEQKYYVDLDSAAYVAKWIVNDEVDIYTDTISGNDEFEFHLTEQEIKDFDERYWAFAKPVKEVNDHL